MRGDISVSGRPRWLRAKSGTGKVVFDGSVQDVALSSISGSIRSSTRFERGRFESVSGDIYLEGPLARGATAEVDNHRGAVTMRLAHDASAAFTVFTVSGRILNELSADRPRQSNRTGAELSFSRADAAARVTVRTFAGPVALRRMQ